MIERRYHLFKIWILGVALAAVGLSVVFANDPWELNEELGFRPRGNVLGGLIIGVGRVVAASCVSGLFYKPGSGMLGAAVGLATWFGGYVLASRWLVGRDGGLDVRGAVADVGGPTIPEVLSVDRSIVVLAFVVAMVGLLVRSRRGTEQGPQWTWVLGGIAIGVATTGAWVLAGIGGASFGPSTVGARVSLVNGGGVNVWLVSFLAALVVGAVIAAKRSSTLRTVMVGGEHGSPQQRAERRADAALDRKNLIRIMPTQGGRSALHDSQVARRHPTGGR